MNTKNIYKKLFLFLFLFAMVMVPARFAKADMIVRETEECIQNMMLPVMTCGYVFYKHGKLSGLWRVQSCCSQGKWKKTGHKWQ